MAHGLEAIDWTVPWLSPWRAAGEPVAKDICAGISCANALNRAISANSAPPVRFVGQSELPSGESYEGFIFRTGLCPTREGLHDFFNGLCWLQFPRTKARLNALHMEQIVQTGIQPVRGPARDGLTVFDENAAFLCAPDTLWDALEDKDWHTLFVRRRTLWEDARLVLFGHALLEKLVSPRKPITAHVYRAVVASNSIVDLDTWVSEDLNAQRLADKPFAHLPVLGVPSWWAANEDPLFYADASVFRPPKRTETPA